MWIFAPKIGLSKQFTPTGPRDHNHTKASSCSAHTFFRVTLLPKITVTGLFSTSIKIELMFMSLYRWALA